MTRVQMIRNPRVHQGLPEVSRAFGVQGHTGDIYPPSLASFGADDLVSAVLSCASDAIARVRVSLRLSRARHGHPPSLARSRRAPLAPNDNFVPKDRVGWRAPPHFRRARQAHLPDVRRGSAHKIECSPR